MPLSFLRINAVSFLLFLSLHIGTLYKRSFRTLKVLYIKIDEDLNERNKHLLFISRSGNQQSTTQVSSSCRESAIILWPCCGDNDNLRFVTCNHCHNISLNYVYSQILIGEEEGQKNVARLSLHIT